MVARWTSLAYTSNRDGTFKIYVMNVRTGEHRRLTQRHAKEWAPAWSPDGKWIAFDSDAPEDILLMAWGRVNLAMPHLQKRIPTVQTLERLTNQGSNWRPGWSPDSQWIAFTATHGDRRTALYIMDCRWEGSVGQQLKQALVSTSSGGTWSLNSKQIACCGSRPSSFILKMAVKAIRRHLIRIRNKRSTKTSTQVGALSSATHPAWSPDGEWIA